MYNDNIGDGMIALLFGDDDNNKKNYNILKSDDESKMFIFVKDYVKDPRSNWELLGGDCLDMDNLDQYSGEDERILIATISQIGDDCVYSKNISSEEEARTSHLGSFLRQMQGEMQRYLHNPTECNEETRQNLQICAQCKNDIRDAVADIYTYQIINWDLDDAYLNCIDFVDDWKNVFGSDLIPPRNKGNDGAGKE